MLKVLHKGSIFFVFFVLFVPAVSFVSFHGHDTSEPNMCVNMFEFILYLPEGGVAGSFTNMIHFCSCASHAPSKLATSYPKESGQIYL